MISEKSLRVAAKELVSVLGLIDEDKKEIIITGVMTPADLAGIVKKAVPLIDPKTDVFEHEETLEIIKEFKKSGEVSVEEEPQKVAERIHEKNIKNKPVRTPKVEEPEPEETPDEEPEPEEEVKPKKEKPKTPKVKNTTGKTKKSIIEELISTKAGATVEQMAKRIVDEGVDDDYKKNLLVVKLWLAKMGFSTTKASIEKNPVFKKK